MHRSFARLSKSGTRGMATKGASDDGRTWRRPAEGTAARRAGQKRWGSALIPVRRSSGRRPPGARGSVRVAEGDRGERAFVDTEAHRLDALASYGSRRRLVLSLSGAGRARGISE